MKTKVEYVWLDGYTPEPSLRSKVKIMDLPVPFELKDIPNWGFDGSSTKQAEGNFSDCYLKPVKIYRTDSSINKIYVLCEVYDGNNEIHPSNYRAKIGEEDVDFWVGYEQEYFIRSGHNQSILGFEKGGIIEENAELGYRLHKNS